MPALLMTAAEIAAAEALAAEILVAQQAAAATAAAAAEAVQVANAAQAAQVAQAAQAAQTGQAAQTLSAAQAGGYGAGTGAGTGGISNLGYETLAQEVKAGLDVSQISNVQPTGIQQVVNAGNYPGSATNPLSTLTPNTVPASSVTSLVEVAPSVAPAEVAAVAPTEAAAASAPPQSTSPLYGSGQAPAGTMGPNTYPDITAQAPLGSSQEQQLLRGKDAYGEFFDNQYNPLPQPTPPATGLQGLIDKGIAYAKDSPISTGLSAMSLYNYLNRPEPYKKPKYQSTFNASTYRGYEPTPPTPYTPQYAQYAQGGLADLGGYSDYARGGRMLKGPGDGMSDDIPATIANKQPARLANEEFVVPADVVSHLGNGSSEAGAKALYKMMDRVRQARTGNKKQGKQINPNKFIPQ